MLLALRVLTLMLRGLLPRFMARLGRPFRRSSRQALYFWLPRPLRRACLWLLGARVLPAMAGGATIVGSRTGLFWKTIPGGLPAILDGKHFPGNVFFVDSNAGNKGDSAGKGSHPDYPFATIDFAIGQCTANQGDAIFVLPGHAETVSAAGGIDADVAGISIVGLGGGESRPVVTFATAEGADLDVDAANITIRNIVFKNNIDSQTAMIDVNAADFLMEDCELREGSAKQALIYVDVAEDRCTIRRCKIHSITAGADSGIKLAAAKDRIIVEDCWIDGDFSDAGIHNPTGTVVTNLLLRRNTVRNRQTGDHAIELVSACTGEAVDNRLFGDTAAAIFDPGSLFTAGNQFGQAIDQESIGYVPLWPTAAVPGNGTSLAAVLRDAWDAVRNGTGGAEPGTNKSLVDALGFDGAAAVTSTAGMLRTAAGTTFVVKKTLTSSAVLTTGVDVTAVSTGGDVLIDDWYLQTDGTGLADGTNFTLETNNAKGAAVFCSHGVGSLGAQTLVDKKAASTGKGTALESGKKVIAKCTVANCTGAGTVDVYLVCRRLADGAALAAA